MSSEVDDWIDFVDFEYTDSHWKSLDADQLTERPVLCIVQMHVSIQYYNTLYDCTCKPLSLATHYTQPVRYTAIAVTLTDHTATS